MTTTVRTNRATNPNAETLTSNFSVNSGTGGTSNVTWNSGVGFDGEAGFVRAAWTVATSAISGGITYSQTGLSASTQYTHSIHVRASKAQTLRMTAQYKDSGGANVGSLNLGTGVAVTANVWYRLFITANGGAAVDRVELKVEAMTGGSNWANGDTCDFDCVLIEVGPSLGTFFDGDYVDGAGVEYAWVGTADASNSTATTYVPTMTLLHKSDAPCDRVEITVTDLQPSVHNVTIWRTADGLRRPVRGVRKVDVVGSDFFTDYEAPLGRLLTYEIEMIAGFGYGSATEPATITVSAAQGWIQDPLDPGSAQRLIATDDGETGDAMLMDPSIKKIEYPAAVAMFDISGSNEPVALLGPRRIAAGIPFEISTNTSAAADGLRDLIKQTPLLLIRPLPEWSAALPGVCYTAAPVPVEMPINEASGGELIEWRFETSLIAAPTNPVVIPTWTYEDWAALWTTYQTAQTALTGDSYLQVKKSPSGA